MKYNIGNNDRFVRIILGLLIIGIGILYQNYWAIIGTIPLITGIIGWCPLYSLFGMSTRFTKPNKQL